MPHCVIEYASELEKEVNPQQLINTVLDGAIKSELFDTNDIKMRTHRFEHFQNGFNNKNFVHVALKILSGRTLEQRANLSQLVLAELANLALKSVSLTVEVVEIERESYAKVVT